jgi:Bacterial transglutaminase-like N-terminal region
VISEIGQLMTVFTVHHTTTYRYRQPERLGPHQLMFRPRDSFDQRSMSVDLAHPAAEKITMVEGIGDDKIRVNSSSLDHPLVILPDQSPRNRAIAKITIRPGSGVSPPTWSSCRSYCAKPTRAIAHSLSYATALGSEAA